MVAFPRAPYLLLLVFCQALCVQRFASAVEPTASHATIVINEHIEQRWTESNIPSAGECSDQVFVRRVYLDLAGRIPTSEEAGNFIKDGREDKHARLVDALLASEDYAQHFADVFDVLLMGRTPENKYAERVKHRWRSYLENVFRSNRPWNEVVNEILLARPEKQTERGAVWFLYERNNKHQEIAESVAPSVFGFRIECAQCHDHMMADEIKQEHYWGLVAFFNRGKNTKSKNGPRVAESAVGGFSDFANLTGDSSPNRLSFLGAKVIDEARPGKDAKQEDKEDLYVRAKIEHDPKVPKFSRREKFVQNVVNDHPMIAKAMVNRLWALLLGRGIVHPFDEMDSVHPASHPALLEWLADDFTASNYNIKRMLRGIVLSKAYRLNSIRPEGMDDPSTFAWYLERPLTAEQLARSIQIALRGRFQNDDPIVGTLRQQFLDVLPDENLVTISDALFMSNNPAIERFIRESTDESHLIGKLESLESNAKQAQETFQIMLGRLPDDAEQKQVVDFIQRRDNESDVFHHLIWAILAGAEFRFNH